MRTLVQTALALAPAAVRRWRALSLPQTAASLAYLSLLAVVPVFTIAVSLLGALPMFASLREALLKFLVANLFLPKFSETLVHYLNQFAAKASELSTIGALIFFASAFSALLTIELTLNRIWHVEHPRSLARRLAMYWMFLTLGPLLLAGSVVINGVVASEFFGGAHLRSVERVWLGILPWVITIGGLSLLYRLLPSAPVRWRDALGGAVVAGVLLEALKQALAMQLARMPTYTIVYGTFAVLPAFLLWLFLFWLMVLAGAVVAASIPGVLSGAGQARSDSPGARFDPAARVLGHLARADAAGEATVRAGEFRTVFDSDSELATRTACMLSDLGYLDRFWRAGTDGEAQSSPWDEYWRLAPHARTMTLRPLFDRVWGTTGGAAGAAFDLREIDRALVSQP